MKVRVTKAEIVEALRSEPLAAGQWIDARRMDGPMSQSCNVCAVGAVLRRLVLSPTTSASDLCSAAWKVAGDQHGPVDQLIADGEYLSALSALFEDAPPRSRRKEAIALVETRFPESLDIDTNGFAPKPGASLLTSGASS